ncbi:galactokinase [Alteribacillus sp. HJP-4]|uniref:galactokinase n=1 Tax=Alteribacillus sp. HJP-4 TaxID=2775394 RepID=UPI0035CD33E7
MINQKLQALKQTFDQQFQSEKKRDKRLFFAPGRVNLIGEHTDYNGGFVFPCAITNGTYALAAKRNDNQIRMYSMNFAAAGVKKFSLQQLDYNQEDDWANYPKGMLAKCIQAGQEITSGFDVVFYGNIPNGAGLSSSASIELATGAMLQGLYELTVDRVKMAKLGQLVENEFIGVNSGIMDQFAISMGKKNHGILLDCHSLEYEYAPLNFKDYSLLIMNSNKERTLASSKYNERREECETALRLIQQEKQVEALGELSAEAFEQVEYLLKEEAVRKRARHAVTENERTKESLRQLKAGNLEGFGKLMNESHMSLRDDYEVTGQELDTLAEAAWEQDGVIGARMTGAGFGGCAIAIVEKDKTEQVKQAIQKIYKARLGYEASFYEAAAGDGAKECTEEVMT